MKVLQELSVFGFWVDVILSDRVKSNKREEKIPFLHMLEIRRLRLNPWDALLDVSLQKPHRFG